MVRGLSNPKQIMLLACLLWQSHCYLPEAALYHPLVQPHLNNYQAQDPHHGGMMMKRKPKSTTSNCFCSSNWICKSGSFLLQPPFQLIIRINNLHGSVKQRNSPPHPHLNRHWAGVVDICHHFCPFRCCKRLRQKTLQHSALLNRLRNRSAKISCRAFNFSSTRQFLLLLLYRHFRSPPSALWPTSSLSLQLPLPPPSPPSSCQR